MFINDDFGFPIVNFPWLSGDVTRLPSYGVYISQLVILLGVVLAFWISILQSSNHFKTNDTSLQI